MNYVRVTDQVVIEVFPYDPFEWLKGSDILPECFEAPDEVEQFWRYIGGEWLEPLPPDPPEPPVDDELAKLKRQVEEQSAIIDIMLGVTE